MGPSAGALRQMVQDYHEKAEDDHKRLRGDLDGVGKKVSGLETVQIDLLQRVSMLERTPVSAEKVTFSGKLLVAIVGSCLVVAGGMWQLHVGIGDLKASVDNAAKLQDERTAIQKEKMDDLGRQIEMRRVEIQRISDKLTEYVQTKQEPHR